jgi:magnesium transporter
MGKSARHKGEVGQPPGTLIYTGEQKEEKVRVTLIEYDTADYRETQMPDIRSCLPADDSRAVTWINIDGIHDTRFVSEAGSLFGIHPLVQEDILNVDQRPKADDMDDYLFIVLKMVYMQEETGKVQTEQVSIVVGDRFVISFQERRGDVFDPIRDRIRKKRGRIRGMGADYLAYALIDAVVDNYFVVLEQFGANLEQIEQELLEEPGPRTSAFIHVTKRELIFLRKAVWPLRELLAMIDRREPGVMDRTTLLYMRDVYDHSVQIIDTIETYRDMVTGLLDSYLSSMSNRMNQIMKVLTVIATIFIPLTFIAGIYGMNFRYMPELEWKWGYPAVLGFMACVAGFMLIIFRRKKWL